jgi:hypothetical protein
MTKPFCCGVFSELAPTALAAVIKEYRVLIQPLEIKIVLPITSQNPSLPVSPDRPSSWLPVRERSVPSARIVFRMSTEYVVI